MAGGEQHLRAVVLRGRHLRQRRLLRLGEVLQYAAGGTATQVTTDTGNDSAPDYTGEAIDHSLLRELRFNLVLRTQDEDPRDQIVGAQQRTENRTAVATTDGFRRRVVTSTVRIRNNQI